MPGANRSGMFFFLLPNKIKQSNNHRKQSNTFNKGRSDDHVSLNFRDSFRLTGDSFNSFTTNLADADTSTNSS